MARGEGDRVKGDRGMHDVWSWQAEGAKFVLLDWVASRPCIFFSSTSSDFVYS